MTGMWSKLLWNKGIIYISCFFTKDDLNTTLSFDKFCERFKILPAYLLFLKSNNWLRPRPYFSMRNFIRELCPAVFYTYGGYGEPMFLVTYRL